MGTRPPCRPQPPSRSTPGSRTASPRVTAPRQATARGAGCCERTRCLSKRLDAALEQAHGLPLTSYEVLDRLEDASGGRMRMCDLAEQAQLSRSGLTRLVDRLERERLLERCSCEHDARGSFACLTRRRARAPRGSARHAPGGRARAVLLALLRARAEPAGRHVRARSRRARQRRQRRSRSAERLTPLRRSAVGSALAGARRRRRRRARRSSASACSSWRRRARRCSSTKLTTATSAATRP